MTNADLVELYEEFNGAFFERRLPVCQVYFHNYLGTGKRKKTYGRAKKFDGRYFIQLSRRLLQHVPELLKAVLLHEMCHIEQYLIDGGGHGPDFVAKAQRLLDVYGARISYQGALFGTDKNLWEMPLAEDKNPLHSPLHKITRNGRIDYMLKAGVAPSEVVSRLMEEFPGGTVKKVRQHVYGRRWTLQQKGLV